MTEPQTDNTGLSVPLAGLPRQPRSGGPWVTGGVWFAGSWLGETLLEWGVEVVCLDNLLTGYAGQRRAPAVAPRLQSAGL